MNPKQQRFLSRVVAVLAENRFLPASRMEIAQSLGVPYQAIEAIVALGVGERQIYLTSQGLVYGKDQLVSISHSLTETSPTDGFDHVSFRDATGLSRRLADGLFQLLGEIGAMRREGANWFVVPMT